MAVSDGGWRVERTSDAAAFLADAEPLLAAQPVLSTVVTTVASKRVEAIERGEPLPDHPFWFALVRDPDGGLAGVAMRTAGFSPNPMYVLEMPDEAAVAVADDVLARGEEVRALNGVQRATRRLAERLAEPVGGSVEVVRPTRLHELGTLVPPTTVPGRLRTARADEVDLAVDWFTRFHDDADREAGREPMGLHGAADPAEVGQRIADGRIGLWCHDGDRPLSLVGWNPTTHGVARIGPVFTPADQRGRGYAGAATAAVSQLLLDEGARVCLFTDLENPVSNHLYERLGYRAVADLAELVVTDRAPASAAP